MSTAVELLRALVAAGPSRDDGRWKAYRSFTEDVWWGKSGTDEFFYEGDPAWRTDVGANGKFWRHVDS
jgi:hypothetical protein